jgi:hypothetical protein
LTPDRTDQHLNSDSQAPRSTIVSIGPRAKGKTMNTHETTGGRRGERNDAVTIRLGAAALALGIIVPIVATAIHPHREDVMDNPTVFTEYANSHNWITVHFAQWAGALLLFGGLLGVYYAIRTNSGLATGLARLGAAAAVQAAAAITALQVVDGVALKWAVDAWASAPADHKDAAFAAAEAVRWTEYGFQSFSNILLGLALTLYGLATVVGRAYPRWLGWTAVASGVAWTVHGVMVPYVGFFDSIPRLAGQVLMGVWAFAMAYLMWRKTGQRLVKSSPSSGPVMAHATSR